MHACTNECTNEGTNEYANECTNETVNARMNARMKARLNARMNARVGQTMLRARGIANQFCCMIIQLFILLLRIHYCTFIISACSYSFSFCYCKIIIADSYSVETWRAKSSQKTGFVQSTKRLDNKSISIGCIQKRSYAASTFQPTT